MQHVPISRSRYVQENRKRNISFVIAIIGL